MKQYIRIAGCPWIHACVSAYMFICEVPQKLDEDLMLVVRMWPGTLIARQLCTKRLTQNTVKVRF